MEKPYKDSIGCWIYPELPDTVRPAEEKDLFTPSGKPNVGKTFLCVSVFGGYVADKVRESTTPGDLYRMLRDKVVYVKK